MKRKGFDLHKIYKTNTGRILTKDELVKYVLPLKKRVCPNCENGVLIKKPLDIPYKILKDKYFILLYANSDGRLNPIIKKEISYLWGCNGEKCSYAEVEVINDGEKTKGETIA